MIGHFTKCMKWVAATMVGFVMAACPVFGQVSSGAILGVVSDASEALIPGVTITVTNEATNQSRQIFTNETGNYRVEPLQSGTYTVTAELAGFRKEIRTGATVNVDSRLRIDFRLQVGEVSEVIEISAEAPVVQTDDSQVGQVIDQRKIIDLPLNGRNFSQLAYLTPGTFAPRPGSHLSDRGGFVTAGMEEKTNQFLIDGVNNNGSGTMETAYRVNIDTVAEFKVQTQNYGAQYGRYAGAHVDAVLKSGTNEFHGAAFAFTRNDNLDARNFFDPWPLDKKAEFKRHQYGATVGGPIIRNKAFFFAGFQGQRQQFFRRGNPTVPFPEYWDGNLSRIAKAIRDPLTGQPFPNNQIPRNRLDPTALKFRTFFFVEPDRNRLSRNASSLMEEPENFWQPDVKVNWSLNDDHQLVASWGLYDSDLLEWRHAGSPDLPNYNYYSKIKNQRLSFQETWTISPTMIHEFRAGISRVGRLHREPFLHDRNYARDVFGIVGTVGDVDPIGNAVPRLQISGYSSLSTAGSQPRVDGNWIVVDTLSMQKGNHAIKLGADVFRQYMNLVVLSNQAGSFTFNGAASGDPFADFLLGLPDTTARAFPLGPISQHPNRYSSNLFVQDDWKATRNLTINYGFRWELTLPMREKWGRLATFDPKLAGGKGGIRLPSVGVDKGERYDDAVQRFKAFYPGVVIERQGAFYKTDKDNFAPRFGFAWTPQGRTSTVVRGGYGVFYTIDALTPTGYYNLAPFMLTQRFTRTDRPTFQNPWPGIGIAGTIDVVGVDPGFENALFQHWNLGVQHELPLGVVIDLGYVGKKGNQVAASRDINQPINGVKPYPLFGPISFNESRGNSNYHGMQTRVEKRSASGLNVLVAYAWGKMIDDVGAVRDSYNLKTEKGLGQEDARHRLMVSYVYMLPFGRGKQFFGNLGGIANELVGGWEFSGILRSNSGMPLTPTLTTDNSGLGRRQDRPDIVGDWRLENPHPTTGWWNRSAFRVPPRGSVGNAGKGSLIGPGYTAMDFSLLKRFQIAETQALQFRFEVFNALNQSNFYPVSARFDGNFGTVGSALENRQIQIGMKYIF